MVKGVLILQDGTVAEGVGFGAEGEAAGEVVFNTSMTGYQEALTDPSYKYQILMFTYPLVGNYGVIYGDVESERIHAEGFVVKELAEKPSHGKMYGKLDGFLKEYGIPGLHSVDTRYLTRKIRIHGVMNGILKTPYDESELEDLKETASKLKSISELDLVGMVTIKKPQEHNVGGKKRVVVIDCGEKKSITQSLLDRKINVVEVPAHSKPKEILGFNLDGIIISNGPGDPEKADYVIKTLSELFNTGKPIFGICLGHQLVGLACGAKTYKLKFGHRGANQPVMDLKTRRVFITSQNHGFAVDAESCAKSGLEVTHINLNDRSVEGMRHKTLPLRSVQYHPEANPGPWDNYYLFDEFISAL